MSNIEIKNWTTLNEYVKIMTGGTVELTEMQITALGDTPVPEWAVTTVKIWKGTKFLSVKGQPVSLEKFVASLEAEYNKVLNPASSLGSDSAITKPMRVAIEEAILTGNIDNTEKYYQAYVISRLQAIETSKQAFKPEDLNTYEKFVAENINKPFNQTTSTLEVSDVIDLTEINIEAKEGKL